MNKEKFIELVVKYLSNEATESEQENLRVLLKQERYQKLFNKIIDSWKDVYREEPQYDFDVEKGLEKLEQKITSYEPQFKWRKENVFKLKYPNKHLKVAASIIFFILLSISTIYLFKNVKTTDTKETVLNVKKTQSGQKSILTLFDGTKITLNANSELRYPTHFGEYSRDVYLKGEAYFEVVHNSKKPFIVHTGNISTKVLGTKFNVMAFANENNIKISLVEGKVKVIKTNNNKEADVFELFPKQQYVYNIANKKSNIKTFNVLKEIGWKDNTFIFDNEPLINVLKKLERAYGVKLSINSSVRNEFKIKANFNNEAFWAIIESIKYATELDYKVIEKNNRLEEIIFVRKTGSKKI